MIGESFVVLMLGGVIGFGVGWFAALIWRTHEEIKQERETAE